MIAIPGGGVRPAARFSSWLPALTVFGLGPVLLLFFLLVHITQGHADLDLKTVVQALIAPADLASHHIVRTLRLPRAVIGVLAGGALAVAGVLLQTLTRNPLASAGTLGINAGAYLAVVATTVFARPLLTAAPMLVALVGGLGAAALAYLLGGGPRATPIRMALAGLAVSMAMAAFTGAFQLLYENETSGLFLWGAGSLIQNDWSGVAYAWPRLLALAVVALAMARAMDLLELGDDVARSLGMRVERVRLGALAVAVALAAITVSVVGPIGFVGLMVPHLVRLLGFRRHAVLIPGALIWGAVVVVGADVAARLFYNAVGELPVGAVTAMVGAPWLIWLAWRSAPRNRASGAGATGLAAARTLPYPVLVAASLALLTGILIAGVSLGGLKLSLSEVSAVFLGGGDDLHRNIIIQMRLPRMLVAALAGAALAVSGLLLQGVVRNPLADPSVVGVTSGAGLGALLILIVWPGMPVSLLPAAAFTGAVASAATVYLIARRDGLSPGRLVLIGMAVSAFGSAGIHALVIHANLRAAVALAWLSGTTYARGWEELFRLAAWPLLLLPLAWLVSRRLDLLALGDDVAAGLGISVERTRLQAASIGMALAAAAVATVGTVGFVGLLAPHAARLLGGHQHRLLLPLAALLGAALLGAADLIGRVALAPKEIPSGLVVALIGAPYFLWLMRKGGHRRG